MDPLKTSPASETRLHFLDYWRIIRIRKAVILSVFLLVAITATIVTFILPKSYAAHSTIRVQRDIPERAGLGNEPSAQGTYDPFFMETEFRVIQSELVLDRVITNLGLSQKWTAKNQLPNLLTTLETRRNLKLMIDLKPVRNTSLIEITAFSDDKTEAKDIANEVARVYKQYRSDEWQKRLTDAQGVFTNEVSDIQNKVKEQEKLVADLRTEYKIVDTDPHSTSPSSSLEPIVMMGLNQQKQQADLDRATAEKELDTLKDLTNYESLRDTLPRIAPDTILPQLLQEWLTARTTFVGLKQSVGPSNPDLIKAGEIKDELEKQIHEQVTGAMNFLATKVAALKARADDAQAKVDAARTYDILRAQETKPYWDAKMELELLRDEHRLVTARSYQEKVELNLPKTAVVELVDTAQEEKKPVRPNRTLNIVLGVIVGLAVGLGLAFFIEYLDTSVKTIDDVERTLQAPVLGVIPQDVGNLLEEGAESPHAEAYRVLRTNLLFSRKDDKLNTMAVVSAGAGEGKSTTVCNLATVFAQAGQRVLMVDSDLRRPTLHKLLHVTNNLGLTNYLMKQNTLEEVVQTTKIPTLHLMASGRLPSSSLGILNSGQMKDLITELKLRYDFIFFDSPPIMGVSDASVLASEVDMTLQVIQYRRYPQPMNIRAKQLIEKVGGNLIGIVLNNINMAQDENYYYYSGYYHDYYSKNEEENGTGSNGAGKDKSRMDIKPKS